MATSIRGRASGRNGIDREKAVPTVAPKKESKNAPFRGERFEEYSERMCEKYNVKNAKFAVKEINTNQSDSDGDKSSPSVAFLVYHKASTFVFDHLKL